MSEDIDFKYCIDNSLFLLGAGASADAGCKTSQEMISVLPQLFPESEFQDAFDFLMSSIQYHSYWHGRKEPGLSHSPNIEDFVLLLRRILNREAYLPYPITGSWADKITTYETSNKSFFQTMLDKIESSLDDWLRVEDTSYLEPLTDCFRAYSGSSFSMDMFTLNYDLVFENHFNSNGVTDLFEGFVSKRWVGFDESITYPNAENSETFSLEKYRIKYYKLHGSLRWWRAEDGSIANDQKILPVGTEEVRRLVVLGQNNKFLSIDPFLSLIYQFRKKLREKKYIFVIGYSFYDTYINNLLFSAIGDSTKTNRKLIVINPSFPGINDQSDAITSHEGFTPMMKVALTENFKLIQQSSYLSDNSNFNVLTISPYVIEVKLLTAKRFFSEYFSSNGQRLLELIRGFEKSSLEDDIFP